jgi:hypothetical protein
LGQPLVSACKSACRRSADWSERVKGAEETRRGAPTPTAASSLRCTTIGDDRKEKRDAAEAATRSETARRRRDRLGCVAETEATDIPTGVPSICHRRPENAYHSIE